MKKFSKVLVAVLVTLLSLTSARVNVSAEPTPPPTAGTDSEYKELAGGEFDFTKYLITNVGQDIPSIEFQYKIEPGKAIPAKTGTPGEAEYWDFNNQKYYTEQEAKDAVDEYNRQDPAPTTPATYDDIVHHDAVPGTPGDFEVFAGIGNPIISNTAGFNAQGGIDSPGIWEELQPGDTLDVNKLTTGKQYSKDKVTVDFSSVNFTEPGIYRYIITELPVEGAESVYYDIEQNGSGKKVIDVYVVDNPEGQLDIANYVLHNTESKVKTTDDMGSKDENAVASGWAISTDVEKGTGFTTYADKEEATKELVRRKSMSIDDPNYDSDILAKNEEIKEKEAEIATQERDKQAAADAMNPPLSELERVMNEAQSAYLKLVDGDNPQGDIASIIGSLVDETDEQYDANLEKFGKTALMAALEVATDAKTITVLRRVLTTLDAKVTIAKNDYDTAKRNYDTANATLEAYDTRIAELNIEKTALEQEMSDLVRRHDDAEVVEVEWTLSDKTNHYTNEIAVYDLEFGKEVEGNQGSKDKYFKFTMTLTGLRAPSVYYRPAAPGETPTTTADGTNAFKDKDGNIIEVNTEVVKVEIPATVITVNDTKSVFTKAPTKTSATNEKYTTAIMTDANSRDDDTNTVGQQLKADENGKIKWEVYLKDGEYINFKDLPAGISYEIVEVSEDYKSTEGTSKIVQGTEEVIEPEYWTYKGTVYYDELAAHQIAEQDITHDTATNKYVFNEVEYDTLGEAKEAAHAACVHTPAKTEGKTHNDPTSGTLDKSVYTGYTNTRNGILPTGVAVAAGAGLVMLGIGAAGMLLFGKRKEDDEDED